MMATLGREQLPERYECIDGIPHRQSLEPRSQQRQRQDPWLQETRSEISTCEASFISLSCVLDDTWSMMHISLGLRVHRRNTSRSCLFLTSLQDDGCVNSPAITGIALQR